MWKVKGTYIYMNDLKTHLKECSQKWPKKNLRVNEMNWKYPTSNCSLSLIRVEGNKVRKIYYNESWHLS